MKFHHRVEINDPMHPLLDALTPEQVWAGLVLRARDPVPFVYELEACTILGESEHSVQRRLQFGNVTIEDEVFFEPPRRIRTVTRAQPGLPSATLIMTIETPGPELLAVRFDYDTGSTADSNAGRDSGDAAAAAIPRTDTLDDDFYDSFRRSAYIEADIDTIGHIRELARSGRI